MAKQNEALFEESSQGAVSAVTATVFVLSMVLMVGGLVLSAYAFNADGGAGHGEGPSVVLFVVGLLATVLGFAVPFNLLPSSGK